MTDGPIEVKKSSRMGAFFVRERNFVPRGYYAIDETGNEGNIFVDNSAQCNGRFGSLAVVQPEYSRMAALGR